MTPPSKFSHFLRDLTDSVVIYATTPHKNTNKTRDTKFFISSPLPSFLIFKIRNTVLRFCIATLIECIF